MEPFWKITSILITLSSVQIASAYVVGLRSGLVAGLDIMWRCWPAYAGHCECAARMVHAGNYRA